uniref:Uncharacterized protein n=1 Tax=Setaria viridis TaxID=4556 RepID=A0A4U6UEW8_SETVI|nr:hypothetical protein SEVIR_5G180400v2 [Setaria viridis]
MCTLRRCNWINPHRWCMLLLLRKWCMVVVLCIRIDGWHRRISFVHVHVEEREEV